MAPKNKKKNSFYFFMKEMQEKEAAKGRRITMMDIPQIAHPIWARLSLAEREPYEEMARQFKNDPCARGGKLASDGTRVEDNLREDLEKKRLKNEMIQSIKNYCNVDCISEEHFREFAPRKLFYFINFNILCQTENEYIPNEVGLVEYSIKNGIHRVYHALIHPGRIPTGYAGEAKRLSEVHEIDIYGEDCSEKDLPKVYNEIKNFTNPEKSDDYPPLFCLPDRMELNVGCLDYLSRRARDDNYFSIWNAVYLLQELRSGINELFTEYLALDLLTKQSFNYAPAARCDFHDEKDNHNCALAYSKRLCYLLSDATCNLFEIELTERHMPPIALEDKAYTVIMSNESSRLQRNNYTAPPRVDSRSSYYPSVENEEEDRYSDIRSVVSSTNTSTHRQPASTCMAAEMARLRLNMTAATVPGHGIGRGQRR